MQTVKRWFLRSSSLGGRSSSRSTSVGIALVAIVTCNELLQRPPGAAVASQLRRFFFFVGAKTAFPTAGAGTGIGGLAASPEGLETGATLAEGLLNRRGGDQHARASLAVAGVGTENDALFFRWE